MIITLRLRIDKIVIEDQQYTTYGVDVIALGEKTVVASFSDISLSQDRVKGFIEICNNNCVSLCHMPFLVDDFISGEGVIDAVDLNSNIPI